MRFPRPNIGLLDQIIRIVISLSMIYLGFLDDRVISDPLSAMILGALGVINLFIALIRFCPLYAMTGIDTRATAND